MTMIIVLAEVKASPKIRIKPELREQLGTHQATRAELFCKLSRVLLFPGLPTELGIGTMTERIKAAVRIL